MPIRIQQNSAIQYIHDNFNISGEATRMCASIFQFLDLNPNINRPETVLLELLSGIGFEQKDIDAMKRLDAIQ